MEKRIPLEKAAEEVCAQASVPPLIFQLPPEQGREVLENIQNTPVFLYPADVSCTQVHTGKWGTIKVYFAAPETKACRRNVILYIHGDGWVFGSYHTHEKLVRELACRTNSVVVFPEYSRSPEARYPTALEQCFRVLCLLPSLMKKMRLNVDLKNLTVAGDSAGGNIAAALALLSKFRKGPRIHKQLLYYPVTNDCFDTQTYCKFANGYYLYREGMKWFWDQYAPLQKDRENITASPLKASREQLKGLPKAMIINGEADVLRCDGQSYAEKLLEAGVSVTAVQIQATIHDFVMLNALDKTNACRTAMDISAEWINRENARGSLKEPAC